MAIYSGKKLLRKGVTRSRRLRRDVPLAALFMVVAVMAIFLLLLIAVCALEKLLIG